MRLDHLLSKEHVPVRLSTAEFTGQVRSGRMFLAGAHGWNIDIDADRIDLTRVRLPFGVGRKVLGREGSYVARSWVLRDRNTVTEVVVDCILWTFSCWQNRMVAGGVGTARTLRTTQWTRAS